MHTVATRRQRGAVAAIHVTSASSSAAALAPDPPASTRVSMRLGRVGQRDGAQLQPALGPDGAAADRGEGDPVPAGPARAAAAARVAPGEDLVRAHRIERLDARRRRR